MYVCVCVCVCVCVYKLLEAFEVLDVIGATGNIKKEEEENCPGGF